jgi:Arc/MetJ-type ribon-helix-helix transcriptional regulator
MKVSVSLPEEDVAFLDEYAQTRGIESRSAAVHRAVGLLRASELVSAYEDAFLSSDDDMDGKAWDAAVADGLDT